MSDLDFTLDVDLAPILGQEALPVCVDARWYDLVATQRERDPRLRAAIDRGFRNAMLHAQWHATRRRPLDRRRAVRVPIISRVAVEDAPSLVATDISLSGLRCSGRPTAPLMDIEFRIPGVQFPVETQAEVVEFKDANVIPLVGLRFVRMDRGYVDLIANYVNRRTGAERIAA